MKKAVIFIIDALLFGLAGGAVYSYINNTPVTTELLVQWLIAGIIFTFLMNKFIKKN